jgi:8-oxo-dGTP pyrophosphatase MutT (NUDIX family)
MNILEILQNSDKFVQYTGHVLFDRYDKDRFLAAADRDLRTASAVLFILGNHGADPSSPEGPDLILNKRSPRVRQSGDLCFPGGSIAPRLDGFLSRLATMPLSPLTRWRHWTSWRRDNPQAVRLLALFLATALRESFEEMRLNPLKVRFLGPLPPQRLVLFKRIIYPMVVWMPRNSRFRPNWEVERIIRIPLKDFLDPQHYATCRLQMDSAAPAQPQHTSGDHPCFQCRMPAHTELLWGATYRITMTFLEYVFGFRPPGESDRQVIEGTLGRDYLTGNGRRVTNDE